MYTFCTAVDHTATQPKIFLWNKKKIISISQKESQWFWFLGYDTDQL